MSRSFYDVVLLGARLGSLLCAALLAKRGFRVLLLDQDEVPPTYQAAGVTLPRAPYTFLAAHSPIARRVMAELALHQAFRRRAIAMDPVLQIALPRHRFDLPLDEAELDREIEREFPEVKRPIEDFHRHVLRTAAQLDRVVERDLVWPPETFLERRELGRASAQQPFDRHGGGPDLLAELPEEHPFRVSVQGPVRFSSQMDPNQTSALAFARLYASWLRGPATIEGGYAALRQMLLEKIQTYTGEVRTRERIDRVLVKRNAVSGVRLASSGEEIGCSFVVSGCDLTTLLSLVPDRSAFEMTFERHGEPQPRYFRYTLNVVVEAEVVPVGMGRDVFFVRDTQAPLEGENLLHVQVDPKDASGHRLLTIEALLPRHSVEEEAGYAAAIRDRILASLGELVPFLGRHVVLVDSPHDGRPIQHLRDKVDLLPDEPWTRGPSTMETVYGFPVPGALGVCALPVRTPIKRLLACSPEVVPGLGDEGTFLAAWSAARLVTKSDRRKEWMRRGVWTKLEV